MSERRPRWWLRILSGVVVLALLGGAAELALRMIIPGIVGAQVRQALDLSSDHQVETELGGSVALRALTGKVGDVTVRVPDAPVVSGIVADLSAHADSVPFNVAGGEIVGGTARITLSSGPARPASVWWDSRSPPSRFPLRPAHCLTRFCDPSRSASGPRFLQGSPSPIFRFPARGRQTLTLRSRRGS